MTTWPLLVHELDDFTEPWHGEPAPVVLLHHGLGGNSRLFRTWVPILGDRYRVLRIDARGQGSSPRPQGYEWSLDAFVGDALQVMNHLGIEEVHWVGTSGGGIIGQHAAATVPDRITSLSLIATTPRFRSPTDRLDDWLAPLDQGDVAEFLRRDVVRRFGTDHPERTEWIISELSRTPAVVAAELHRWVVGVDLIPVLPNISQPTLVVTGEYDTLTDLRDAKLLASTIPNARLHVIEGHPHNVGYTHPHLVASIVRRFLDEVSCSGALRSGARNGGACRE